MSRSAVTIWFIGLSGVGNTTVNQAVKEGWRVDECAMIYWSNLQNEFTTKSS